MLGTLLTACGPDGGTPVEPDPDLYDVEDTGTADESDAVTDDTPDVMEDVITDTLEADTLEAEVRLSSQKWIQKVEANPSNAKPNRPA